MLFFMQSIVHLGSEAEHTEANSDDEEGMEQEDYANVESGDIVGGEGSVCLDKIRLEEFILSR